MTPLIPAPLPAPRFGKTQAVRQLFDGVEFGNCDFGCGPDEDRGTVSVVHACAIHGMIDFSKGIGAIKTHADNTLEVQAMLLIEMLRHASVDIVEDRISFTGGWDATEEQIRLMRILLSVAQ